MRGCKMMVGAMVCGALGGCCTKKMSSDVAARDSMHRERREVAADSFCQKAMRDRVLESATVVEVVIEEDFWVVPSCPDPYRESLTGAPEKKCPLPARRRTTITARKDVKETEKETEETKTKTLTMTEEREDSVAEKEEHVKEEKKTETWRWPVMQIVWVGLCCLVLWRVWRRG